MKNVGYHEIFNSVFLLEECRQCKFKSDTDRLYTSGDRVTHIETGTVKFAVLD